MKEQGTTALAGVRAGSCGAWSLPADGTCAGVARRLFRDATVKLGLEPAVLDDAILMASELAANTLHASEASRAGHARSGAGLDGSQELWLYLRGAGIRCELVCKVFDSFRGWLHGPPPAPAPAPSQAVCGRGLQIVHELSGGRWGHHLTRARLGEWALRGKAVWFAVPAPLAQERLAGVAGLPAVTMPADVTVARRHQRDSAREAARQLELMLGERGLGGARSWVARTGENDASVLSLCRGLTLQCQAGWVSLTGPGGCPGQWAYADLVEAAEQAVRRFEELDSELAGPGLLVTVTA